MRAIILPTRFSFLCLISGVLAFSSPAFADAPSVSPEAQLLNIYQQLAQGQSEQALTSANTLVEQYPKFNLGHLVRGDILLSRTRPLTTVGDTSKSAEHTERLNELREEARSRLQALTTPPPQNALPDALVQISQDTKHVLVVDASRARLYLFANQNGRPRLVTDYYVSIGKAGSDKQTVGDLKTPLGVYRITSSIPGAKLTDFYGKGALTLNYPNALDQKLGRTGYGIWLHGVPSTSYNRAPKASNGCVVLSNPDMESLLNRIQPGTPVVISNQVKWLPLAQWQSEQQKLLDNVLRQRTENREERSDTISVFRYPAQKDMLQVSYDRPAEKARAGNTPRDQYWTFDGSHWQLSTKSTAS